jgi:hypothetical protein
MNKNQVKGAVKEAAGKVQQKTGQILGSSKQEAKGLETKRKGTRSGALPALQSRHSFVVLAALGGAADREVSAPKRALWRMTTEESI